jgi:Caenorhabditis protein of unknown function, DUF268
MCFATMAMMTVGFLLVSSMNKNIEQATTDGGAVRKSDARSPTMEPSSQATTGDLLPIPEHPTPLDLTLMLPEKLSLVVVSNETATGDRDKTVIPAAKTESKEESMNSSDEVTAQPTTTKPKSTTEELDMLLRDEILPRLERVKKICGPLCEIDSSEKLAAVTVQNSDTLLPQVRVPIDCKAIMESEDIDASDPSAPYPLPEQLHNLYSLNGTIEIQHWKRFADILLGGNGLDGSTWDEQLINGVIEEVENGTHRGTYSAEITNRVHEHLRKTGKIKDSRVLVIGSHIPWLEAICLLLEAKEVVTLEYGKITSNHPRLTTLTPSEFRGLYINNTLGQFDTIVSFSSIEHSGLGRYGDALNPWGDLLAIARAWCVTKPGGALALGLPTGLDYVTVNAHRVYGKVRWPLVSANWVQVDSKLHSSSELEVDEYNGQWQSLMVFEKPEETGG